MCTVTWLVGDGGYELFANRDELRSRSAALPPSLHSGGRRRNHLAPVDPDGGGTWISVNEAGVGLALLNDYLGPQASGEFESRGRLVSGLAGCGSSDEVARDLGRLALDRYRPFLLAVLAPGSAARVHHWDGRRAVEERSGSLPLLTSSSFDPMAVDGSRRELLARHHGSGSTAERLEAFHRSHQPESGPLSPCMHRADARTVSLTRLSVSGSTATMTYLGGAPCDSATRQTVLSLALERARGVNGT